MSRLSDIDAVNFLHAVGIEQLPVLTINIDEVSETHQLL